MEEQKKLLSQLVRGEIYPENEFVAYLVEKSREALVELEQVSEREKQLMHAVAENQQRKIQIRSTLDAYATDIMHWQKEVKIDETVNKTNVGDDLGED